MKHFIFTLSALLFANYFYSQENDLRKIKLAPPILNTDSLINSGVSFYEEKKYDEAILEFEKINENDSNYTTALYEIILTHIAQKKDSDAIRVCEHLMRIDKIYYPKALILKGNALDNLKQYEKSKAIYLQGAKEFPYSPKFYHELAISNFNQKKYKEAEANFINAINVNAQYAPSHFQMGLMALKQKRIIPAMLSFQYYLLLDNSSKRAKTVIDLLEKIGDDAIKYEDFDTFSPLDENNDFSELEAIVKSKAAYGDKFKSKVKLNFRLLKQIQVVLEKLEYNPGDAGFYSKFYGKFFTEMVSKGFTETYMYFILGDMNIEDANKWLKSNKEKSDDLKLWYYKYMRDNHNETTLAENTPSKKAYKIYLNGEIASLGNLNDKNQKKGYWKYLHSGTTILKSEGAYNDNEEKTGPWKYYYEDGSIKEVCTFKNNNIDGEYFKYYNNGKIMNHLFYKDGKFDGKQSVYHSNGQLKNIYEYKLDVLDGEETGYYTNGKLNYKATVKQNVYDGIYTVYYENGSVKKTITFLKGVKAGPAKEYYNHPKDVIYAEGNYENDNPTGEWKYYYNNGKISNTGILNKKGQKDGVWKDYSREGVMIEEDTYSDGRSEGVSKNFYSDGKIYEEFYYRKNKINLYKFYNTSGTLVKEISKQKNEFNFELYNKNGTVRLIGKLNGEQIDGQLNSFNYVGLKSETTDYKNDQKINTQYKYYPNGQVLTETPYQNSNQHGLFTKYFANGKVLTKGYYVNDNPEGYWFYYDKNGPLVEIRHYLNGEQTGWQRLLTCQGKLSRAERLEDGRIVERCYYDTIGNVIKRVNYDSCNNCPVTIASSEGNPWLKRNLKGNFIHGVSYTYYPDGKVQHESTYDMDLENGISKSYDMFGKLQREAHYDYDVKQGKLTTFRNDKPQYTANYMNGQIDGETTDYYDSGKPFQTTMYVADNLEGPLKRYDEDGNLAIVLNYVNDNLVSYQYENENGQLVAPIEINKPDMEVKAFYKNKKPSVSFTIKNGEKEGAYIMNSAAGIKILEEQYAFGYLNGTRTGYYPSGKLKSKVSFSYGDYNGMYLEYNENGSLKSEFSYVNDNRHGVSKYYDNAGKLLLKSYYYDDNALKIYK